MKPVDGYLEPPERPGSGRDLVEDASARFPFRSWHRPFQLRPDGSLAFQYRSPIAVQVRHPSS